MLRCGMKRVQALAEQKISGQRRGLKIRKPEPSGLLSSFQAWSPGIWFEEKKKSMSKEVPNMIEKS